MKKEELEYFYKLYSFIIDVISNDPKQYADLIRKIKNKEDYLYDK